MAATLTRATAAHELVDAVGRFYADPLGFVMFAYQWGEPGTPLRDEPGPDDNQRQFLIDLGKQVQARRFNGSDPVLPIKEAASSGHGTGKSAMGAWIADWIRSTRPFSIGTVTASTYTQLETRTWAAIQHWGNLSITKDWFHITKTGVYSKFKPESWKIVPQTCRRENAQSFAGQHARNSTSWYLFDEASDIPDEIWQTAYGGMTDGEPMMFAWGQMVRNSGEFHRVCFGSGKETWGFRIFDGETSRFTNKALIQQWKDEYGADSDFIRVRVKGLPPRASELQFIGQALVDGARKRSHAPDLSEPLIAGFDAANGGLAWNVVRFRRGLDAETIAPIRMPGDTPRDTIVAKLAEVMSDKRPERKVTALFGDAAFGAAAIVRLQAMGFSNCFEVNFGAPSPDSHEANMRAYMWARMKRWLELGAIPDEQALEDQLLAPGFHINPTGKLVLESKQDMAKRGVASPDDADALALTFARNVAPPKPQPKQPASPHGRAWGWT